MIRNVVLPKGSRDDKPGPQTSPYAIEQDVQKQWLRLLNVAAFFCDQQVPSLSRKLEWICSTLLVDGYQNMIDPKVVERFAKYGLDLFAEIEEGRIRCVRCGSRRVTDLQGHHRIPRSRGGHQGPVDLLCGDCHDDMHTGGGWKDHAASFEAPKGEDE